MPRSDASAQVEISRREPRSSGSSSVAVYGVKKMARIGQRPPRGTLSYECPFFDPVQKQGKSQNYFPALREDFLPPTERAGAALLSLESRDVCQASESSRGGGKLGFIILPGRHRFVFASRRRGPNLPK